MLFVRTYEPNGVSFISFLFFHQNDHFVALLPLQKCSLPRQ